MRAGWQTRQPHYVSAGKTGRLRRGHQPVDAHRSSLRWQGDKVQQWPGERENTCVLPPEIARDQAGVNRVRVHPTPAEAPGEFTREEESGELGGGVGLAAVVSALPLEVPKVQRSGSAATAQRAVRCNWLLACGSRFLALQEHVPNLARVLRNRPSPMAKAAMRVHRLRPFV